MIGELPCAEKNFRIRKDKMRCGGINSSFTGNEIKSCSGAGSFTISNAIQAGQMPILTADLKYHQFYGK
jgi:hypothetical protein